MIVYYFSTSYLAFLIDIWFIFIVKYYRHKTKVYWNYYKENTYLIISHVKTWVTAITLKTPQAFPNEDILLPSKKTTKATFYLSFKIDLTLKYKFLKNGLLILSILFEIYINEIIFYVFCVCIGLVYSVQYYLLKKSSIFLCVDMLIHCYGAC